MLTSSDYLEEGTENEEIGDRWIISDLSKSIRFYQKAYDNYVKSIELDSSNFDSIYNLNRLIFHVYLNFNSLSAKNFQNIDGCFILDFDITSIKLQYDKYLKLVENDPKNWEFFYNLVLINTEIIEDVEVEQIEALAEQSITLCYKIFEYQLSELDLFIRKLEGEEVTTPEDTTEENDEFNVKQQIIPDVVLDSVIVGMRLIQSVYDRCNYEQLSYFRVKFSDFLQRLVEVFELLFGKFSPNRADSGEESDDKYGLNLSVEEVVEFKLVNKMIESNFVMSFPELVSYWNSVDISTSSKYLIQTDSLLNFKERNLSRLTQDEVYVINSELSSNLKKAYEIVKTELGKEQKEKSSSKISKLVYKLCEILIKRSDFEFEKLRLDQCELSVKNGEVIKQNVVNLLKSCNNLSKTNCGLREVVIDRLNRESVQRECVARLILLTFENPTESDFRRLLGESFYVSVVEELKEHELYGQLIGSVQP